MPFSSSSESITLSEDGITLSAQCQMDDGTSIYSEIQITSFLGNVNGQFSRGGTDYHLNSRNFELQSTVLRAELQNGEEWICAEIDLEDHIDNINGVLTLIVSPCIMHVAICNLKLTN